MSLVPVWASAVEALSAIFTRSSICFCKFVTTSVERIGDETEQILPTNALLVCIKIREFLSRLYFLKNAQELHVF